MDIIIHSLSGMLVASCMAGRMKDGSRRKKLQLTLVGTLMGAFPDIDALSLAPGFDTTIGNWFNLPPGSAIYSGKLWYSHHAFMHSLLAAVLFSGLCYWMWQRPVKYGQDWPVWGILFGSYCAHLLGDLPTPASSWGGIQLFFPFKTYVGGWGWTWWWNNYDVFALLVIGNVLALINNLSSRKNWIGPAILGTTLVLCTATLKTRNFDFAYTPGNQQYTYTEMEVASKKIQQQLLGPTIYNWILKIDNLIPLYF